MVAKYSSDRIQDALSAEAWPICLDSANHQHHGSPAPGSSRPDRNNPSQYACKAAGMLQAWWVWQGWWAWHWQPALPYQFVGNGLSIGSSSAASVNPANGVVMKWLTRLRWLANCEHQSLPNLFDLDTILLNTGQYELIHTTIDHIWTNYIPIHKNMYHKICLSTCQYAHDI